MSARPTLPDRSRATKLLLLIGLVCALALSACGGGEDPPEAVGEETPGDDDVAVDETEEAGEEETEEAGDPRRGGTLIQVIAGDPGGLNPALTTATPDLYVACKVFEGLVRLDSDYDVVPGLAEDWDVAEDGLTYTFYLREGVTWHDGEPFTSADVRWTFENVTSEYGPRSAAAFDNVASIDTPDDHTVIVNMSQPYGVLLPLLTCANSAILPEHVYGDGQDITSHPRNSDGLIGTGPFEFESWDHGQAVTLVRYDDYWRSDEGMPFLDRFILRPIDNPEAATLALEAGDVDVVTDYSLDMAAYQRLSERDDLHGEVDTNLPTNNVLILNTAREPFSDVRVRQALFHAIDREAIIQNVHFGLGNPGRSSIDSRLGWAYNPDVDYNEMYPYDPDRAAELLDEAGLTAGPDGTRTSITLPYETANPDYEGTAQIIRENLRQVGVDVELQPMERTAFRELVFHRVDADMSLNRYTTFGEVAIGVARQYVSTTTGEQPPPASGYVNLEVDELFAQGAAGSSPEERAGPYHRVQEILAEDLPLIVLTENPSADLVNARVQGMWVGPDPYDWWEEVYLDE